MNQIDPKPKNKDRQFFKSTKAPVLISKEDFSIEFSEFQKNFIKNKQDHDIESEDDEVLPVPMGKLSKEPPINRSNISKALKGSSFLVKKFISILKKAAYLNSYIMPKTAILLDDLTFFISDKKKTLKRHKLFMIIYWIKRVFFEYYCKGKFKHFEFKAIHPFEKTKVGWDIFMFLNTFIMFFFIPMQLSFVLMETNLDTLYTFQFVIYFLDIMINFNTCYLDNGVLIKDRTKICVNYLKENFVLDLIALFGLLMKQHYFIADKEDENVFYFKLLFFAKVKPFKNRFNKIKEYFCLDSKMKGSLFYTRIHMNNYYLLIMNRNIRPLCIIRDIIDFFAFIRLFFPSYSHFEHTKRKLAKSL